MRVRTLLAGGTLLEAYLGVTLKRLFSTGPEAFEEIYRRLEQFTRSLREQGGDGAGDALPPAVVETVTSLAFAIDAKDHYTQGHSQKVSAYSVMIAQALGLTPAELEEIVGRGQPVWLVYTFPRYLEAAAPGVPQVIRKEFTVGRVFHGTLGEGDVVVVRSQPK